VLKKETCLSKARPKLAALPVVTICVVIAVLIRSPSFGSSGADIEKSFQQQMHEAMTSMDREMENTRMTGDPDHDFAAMMIPHHQGAIDMAKAELLYGKDPVLRRLAQEIIVTQEQEIAVMRMRLK
jgi:uncharacterized protein (DUF305 family)